MKLKFNEKELAAHAERYQYRLSDNHLAGFGSDISQNGYLSKDELRAVAKWKSPRSAGHIEKNSPEYIKEVTQFAFSASDERSRIESLTLLDGVRWPSASVILHFFHHDPYPVLDFRALWSLDTDVPNVYKFELWWEYVCCCRGLAKRNELSMRELDKALWQHSKENQK